jgi:hypothetical protein
MTTSKLLTLAQQLEVELRATYISYATTDPAKASLLLGLACTADGIVHRLREMTDHAPAEQQEYRMLEVGETIQKGDQFGVDKHWVDTLCADNIVKACDVGLYRRPITRPAVTADEFQVLTESAPAREALAKMEGEG